MPIQTRLLIAVGVLFVALVVVMPNVVHALDAPAQRPVLEVDTLDPRALPSRRVTVVGRIDYAQGMIRTTTTKEHGAVKGVDHTVYYPLLGATPRDDVTVLLLSNEGDLADMTTEDVGIDVTSSVLSALGVAPAPRPKDDRVRVSGVVRNVLWESGERSIRKGFAEAGLADALRGQLVVIEVDGRHASNDRTWAIGGLVGGLVFAIGVFLRLGEQEKEKEKGRPSQAAN